MPAKFSGQHYNAIAKDIREELEEGFRAFENARTEGDKITGTAAQTYNSAIIRLMTKFAKRFAKDNEKFDPVRFLNACSPDPEMYPLGELWDE